MRLIPIKDENITITLTIQERNIFKSLCEEFLGSYKVKLSRNRAKILNKILDKLEDDKKI